MSSSNRQADRNAILEIQSEHRWPIYHRLQSLDISCWCSVYKPLQVQLDSPLVLIQVQQVIRQITASRQDLMDWLEVCWQQPYEPPQNSCEL